jgi:hypothetical protein
MGYLKNNFILFLVMGSIGITTEIFFTAFYEIVIKHQNNLALKGASYVWMLPIYGLTAYAFPPVIERLKSWNFFMRSFFFAIGILVVEYIMGALLKFLTGSCPWEYQEGWHLHGFIRFDYFPLWMIFSMGVEKILVWLAPRLEWTGE